ncbi:cell division cycle-associated protein 2 [Gastrophryne carolinensis]
MASRKALQELAIMPPQTEQQSFVVITEEEPEAADKPIFSLSGAHAKYISDDEAKENITPAFFDNDTVEKSKPQEKISAGETIRLENQESGSECVMETTDWRLGTPSTPIDFAKVTVDDLGISSESFTNKCSGKSPRSLQKYRRRSTIGVRGSPEMNFLIRQIALQRSNRKSGPETPTSPFLSPRNSILKEKMLSFRNAFQAVEENEVKPTKIHGNVDKAEPPEKRKKLCDPSLPESKAPHAPVLDITLESDGPAVSAGNKSAPSACGKVEDKNLPAPSSVRCRKRKVMFEGIPASPEPDSTASALRPVLKKTPRREPDCFKVNVQVEQESRSRVSFDTEENLPFKKPVTESVKKKKQVTFGKELSPELFDKTLPANTPLRRGSTPYRPSDAATQPALEAVCQSPYQPLLQPDFDYNDEDTLQPLALCFDAEPPNTDCISLDLGKPNQDSPTGVLDGDHFEVDASTGNEPSQISYGLSEDSSTAATDNRNETFIAPEPDTVLDSSKATLSSKNSTPSSSVDSLASASGQTTETSVIQGTAKPKTTSRRGRKPVVVKKSQVKAPQDKGKRQRGRPKKGFQKQLYGPRETASKKPLLSPITELPECFPTPPSSTPHLGKGRSKGIVKRILKNKSIGRNTGKVKENHQHSEVVDCSPNSLVRTAEDADRLEQEALHHTDSVTNVQNHTQPVEFFLQRDTASSECPLSDKELEQTKFVTDFKVQDAVENISDVKPQKASKRRSTTKRRLSQTTAELASIENPEIASTNILSNSTSEDGNSELNAENTKPLMSEQLAENSPDSCNVPVITGPVAKKRGRPPKGSRRSASFLPIAEVNFQANNPCTVQSHVAENVTNLPSELCLPIDEIFQSSQDEKKVRRSMRLRRDSDVIGLSWVDEIQGNESSSRRKSFSSAVTFLEGPNLLENVTHSPNKENISGHPVPSATKKVRRRTLCTSSLQDTTSHDHIKRRRSNTSYKDSSVKATTVHSILSLEV